MGLVCVLRSRVGDGDGTQKPRGRTGHPEVGEGDDRRVPGGRETGEREESRKSRVGRRRTKDSTSGVVGEWAFSSGSGTLGDEVACYGVSHPFRTQVKGVLGRSEGDVGLRPGVVSRQGRFRCY